MTGPDPRHLWTSVILQAITDATDCTLADTSERDLLRRRARLWFNPRNPDFVEVCSLAGLDPENVVERARKAIARHDAGERAVPVATPAPRPAKPEASTLTHHGLTLTRAEWSERTGIPLATLSHRIRAGMPVELALTPGSLKERTRRPIRTGYHSKRYTFEGETHTLAGWAKIKGIDYELLSGRIRNGMTIERALTMTPRQRAGLHTVNGTSKTLAEWAASIGITYDALIARMKGRTLAQALAMPAGRHHRGVGSDFDASKGTGGGSTAQDSAEIDFSQEAP